MALYEAAEAQYHQREHVLQMPGQLHCNEEFTAKENVLANILKKPPSVSEGAMSNNITVQVSNLLSEKGDKEEKQTTRMGLLTFDVNPELKDDKHVYLAAVNDQASSCAGITALATWPSSSSSNSLSMERSQRPAKVKPPACAGCLFGAMTKVPFKGQEISFKVFVAMKAGQCVTVNQMILMQVGFITQSKGTLTKKCYTVAIVFVDHYSRLKYIHLMTKLTSEKNNGSQTSL